MKKDGKVYTREELINIVKEKTNELKRAPLSSKMRNPYVQTFINEFGSWNDVLSEIGVKPKKEFNKFTRDDLIKILQDAAQKYDKIPSPRDILSPSTMRFVSVFGSWSNALKEAGFNKDNYKKDENFTNLSEEQLKIYLMGFKLFNGDLLMKNVKKSKLTPSIELIMKKLNLDSWNDVIKLINKLVYSKL